MNWKLVNDFIEQKSTGLMEHENEIHRKNPKHISKDYARTRFDESHAVYISDRGRNFIVISTSVFFEVMHEVLPQATKQFPENFGVRDAYKVLEAIYNVRPVGS